MAAALQLLPVEIREVRNDPGGQPIRLDEDQGSLVLSVGVEATHRG
jgi:hypothetical protein